MKKTIIYLITTLLFVLGVGLFEVFFIKKGYKDIYEELKVIDTLAHEEQVTINDFLPVLQKWEKLKERSELFIHHNDTTEFNMRMQECKAFIIDEEYGSAQMQLAVLLFLAEYIPESMSPHLENIL